MVLDPLKNAMSITKNVSLNSATSSVNSAEEARRLAQNQLDATQAAAQAKDMLAQYKDPEFLKKEAEAKVMALIADKQQELLAQKTEIEKQVAEKITLLLTLYLAFPPKLPAIDVKAAAKKAYAKTKKELQAGLLKHLNQEAVLIYQKPLTPLHPLFLEARDSNFQHCFSVR